MDEFSVYADESLTVLEIIDKLDVQFQNYRNNKDEVIETLKTLLVNSVITSDQLKVLEEYFSNKALELNDLELSYLPELNLVKSQLAETMNKTSITLSHIFTDNTARDTYFTANPLEKINLTFIKVGTGYQQLINGVWTSANPVIAEVVTATNQPFTPVGGISANNTQAAIAELDTEKANKLQEAWITPTLINSWVAASGFPVAYMIDSLGFVHMKGRLTGGATSNAAFTLPVGYRPEVGTTALIFGNSSNGAFGNVYVYSNGGVVPTAGSATSPQLDGITFRAV